MKATKAIEVLQIFRDEGEMDLPPDVEPAINLGIEALKLILCIRTYGFASFEKKIPGETW